MLCEHGNVSPCVECDIEPLRSENKKLREKVAALVEALELALEYWRHRQQRYKNRKPRWVTDAESAIATHRKPGGDA